MQWTEFTISAADSFVALTGKIPSSDSAYAWTTLVLTLAC